MSRPEDRSLILKCCALVERGDLPEAWWTDAIGSVSRTNGAVGTIANKMGYLYTTLVTNAAEKYHAKLEPLLAAIDVPAAILAPKKPQPTEV
ncbi:MAG: hypothetical protein NTW96_25730 [Planctomycetia bacterium]|nr:hypothetical protein [Planctomycetia bacterium]